MAVIDQNWPYNQSYNHPTVAPSLTTSLTTASPPPHLNFFQHYFGTSLVMVIANVLLVAAVLYLAGRFILLPLARLLLDALDFGRLFKQGRVFLELTPPAPALQTHYATAEFFTMLHSLGRVESRQQRWRRHKSTVALEIVSTRRGGIRYIAAVPERSLLSFKQALQAYAPKVRWQVVKDYLPASNEGQGRLLQFKQVQPRGPGLPAEAVAGEPDTLSYLTSTMTQLAKGELVVFQVVLTPATPQVIARLGRHESRQSSALWPPPTLPLMQVDIRGYILSKRKRDALSRAHGLIAALQAMQVPGLQSVQPGPIPLFKLWQRFSWLKFKYRLPALLSVNSAQLAVSQVARLYHFPYAAAAEDTVAVLSRALPAPRALKQGADTGSFDVVLGRNQYHGQATDIGLSVQERERHVYIIGGTGNGKTTMLQYGIVQDMRRGKGLAVIDPHGDLAETVLRAVPRERMKDVVYFNPDDLDYPIGLNLLELRPGLSGNALLREKDIITESVVSVFRKLFSDEDSGGHRIEYVLRNAIHTALTVEGATLFTVLKLLQNSAYRRRVTDKLEDEDLKDFWKNEFGQAGSMQRVKLSVGITAKIGRFKSNAAARAILSQEQSTIDFEDIMNSGKILICNFSKGRLGEDITELFGITTLAKLQLASLRRARLAPDARRPFYLYVDEFQNFATPSFVQMLSEARKYKLGICMAEQSTAQQKDQQMVNIILANVGTVICFRTGSPADERLLLPLFSPYLKPGEIANLPAFHFYARLSSLQAQQPVSGQTQLLDDSGSSQTAGRVIALSRAQYGQVPHQAGKAKLKAPEKPLIMKRAIRPSDVRTLPDEPIF